MKFAFHLLLLLGPVIALNLQFAETRSSLFAGGPLRAEESLRGKFQRLMASQKPQLVVMGTSAVQLNIDASQLSRELNVRTGKVARAAIGPAWIYLAFKNVVLAADPPPSVVVIGYRGDEWMRSGFRSSGAQKKFVDDMAVGEEPEVVRRAYLEASGSLYFWLQQHSRLFRERDSWKHAGHRWLQSRIAGQGAAEIARAAAVVFADEERDPGAAMKALENEVLDPGERERWQANRALPAEERIERSFVPLMIEQARKRGVALVFMRLRQEQHARGKFPQAEFVASFSRYLAARGVDHVDLSRDPSIRREHFSLHDHIERGPAVSVYSRAVSRLLEPVIQARLEPGGGAPYDRLEFRSPSDTGG